MTKVTDFAGELAERYGLTETEAADFITMMFDVINEQLDAPDKLVKVKGLGTFKVTSVGARASVDVNTGERIILEGRNKISFAPEVALRDRVNRPFVQFETVVLNEGVDFSDIDAEYKDSKREENTVDSEKDNTEIVEAEPNDAEQNEVEASKPECFEPDIIEEKDAASTDVKSSEVETADAAPATDSCDGTFAVVSDVCEEDNGVDEAEMDVCNVATDLNAQEKVETKTEEPENRENEKEKTETKTSSVVAVEHVQPASQDISVSCKQRNPRLMYWFTAASFALLVCIGIGMYFLYRQVEAKNTAIEQLQTKLAVHTDKVKIVHDKKRYADKHVAEKKDTSRQTAAVAQTGVKHEPMAESPAAVTPMDYNYDVRIRTGAYVIVGTDRIVEVKAGQTLSSISRANLGPGMECYVEVFNGCKEAKPGDKLRIPKLKLKKLNKGQ